MKNKDNKEYILRYRLLYTMIILFVYMIGKSIPLVGVDWSYYLHKDVNAELLLLHNVTGDMMQSSIFALGISPIVIASIFVQLITSISKSESREKKSPKKQQNITLVVTLILTIIQAIIHVDTLVFKVTGIELVLAKIIAIIEMISGVMIILWLISRNKSYGIGGQTTFIFLNVIEGILFAIKGNELKELMIPVVISLFVLMLILIMENSEKRIPVQRISIHNIYADKNYMAIKLNPVGVMPAMFSTAVFMIPQILTNLLLWIIPENRYLLWIKENMLLSKPLGLIVYVMILYVLTIVVSRIFLNPKEITEQYLKSGDSIVNIHAGKKTKEYLSRTINRLSFLGATVMSICLVVPLILQMNGSMQTTLAALPTSVMMLTGLWCNLYRECVAIYNLEAYKPFI